MDETMSFNDHLVHVNNKVSSAIGQVNFYRKYLTEQLFIVLLNCFILSYIDYGIHVWGCVCVTKLEKLQKRVTNFIKVYYYPTLSKLYSKQFWSNDQRKRQLQDDNNLIKMNKKIYAVDLLEKCNILSVPERYNYYLLLNLYKTIKCLPSIPSLKELFVYKTRNDEIMPSRRLELPKFVSKIFKKSVQYHSIELWNDLPINIREARSVHLFKNLLCQWCLSLRK
jgi:hypothetical protein